MKDFLGYHSEWNLGSPGGWDYQRMAQELGKVAWERIKKISKIEIELNFDHPLLNPVPAFAQMLLKAHERKFGQKSPFIVLVAEEETLEKVGENIHFVDYLNSLLDVKARLTVPHRIERKGGDISLEGEKVTCIFMDFNNNVLVKLRKKYDLEGLLDAIREGIVINPRGMEPLGAKGIFEIVTGEFKSLLTRTTIDRTPWTRRFYQRPTTGPRGEPVSDLVQWARGQRDRLLLKPVHGYSGHGIFIGYKRKEWGGDIQYALDSRNYILQLLIPLELWAEEFPWVDHQEKRIFIKRWQTDFRCFITDEGLIGFVTRFGGIPTNVGSGGGVQPTAILRSEATVKEAIDEINNTIISLGYDRVREIQDEIDRLSIQMGNVYLLGPIMTTLRPRIIAPHHLDQLKEYCQDLWDDLVKLERLWQKGELDEFVDITEEEKEIAQLQPWNGSHAIMATDGLFNFQE